MTELQWLIKMLTQHKMPGALKDLFIERIGEVETNLSSRPIPKGPAAQAPSMQALIDHQPPVMPVMSKRIIGGDVDNGDGTKGKRKF